MEKKWSCYPVDMREKNILIGWPLGQGEFWEDYLVAPLIRKKGRLPLSNMVPSLVTLDLDGEKGEKLKSGEGLYYSGYHDKDKRMYSGTRCKISQYKAYNDSLPTKEQIVNHSCPELGGFSGSPLFYFDEAGKPKVFGVHFSDFDVEDGKEYNPMKYQNNQAFRLSPDLIKKINEYCENYLKRKQ